MKAPSSLGASIEAAIDSDPRFHRHREPIQYLCCYRTTKGQVFAFERVTASHITLWMPEIEPVRRAAEREYLSVVRSVPRSNPAEPTRYGRLSSLESVPELRDAVLYRIRVGSVGQAVALAGALI
jgi:hypothetical protein